MINESLENEENAQILRVLANYPEGASLQEIKQLINNSPGKMPKRTLQRKLLYLGKIGKIIRTGHGRAIRYLLKPGELELKRELTEHLSHEAKSYENTNLILSEDSIPILQYIKQPLENRRSVGYHAPFLEKYQPNHSYYLSEAVREHLKKIGHLPHRDLAKAATYSKKMINQLLIDLSWNSSRLEGNTYSLLETERLIVAGKIAEGKSLLETQMIINHKKAIEFLVESNEFIGFNRYTILNLHALLSEGLLGNPEACGRLRDIVVGIHGTAYHPLDIPQQMEEYFEKILAKAQEIMDPFEQAFFPLVHISYLQPFEDINKRVSRLSANIPLIKHNICPLSFIDVPEKAYIDGILGVYELNNIELLKDIFVWAYEKSSERYASIRQILGEPDPFRMQYRSQLQEIITIVIKQNLNKNEAISIIHQWALETIPEDDQTKFIEMVEKELLGLHEGNFARYYISPSEFNKWYNRWIK